jgi:hypothetical protein
MKRAALSPKKTGSSQETTTFEKQSREFLFRTERTLIQVKKKTVRFAVREIKAVLKTQSCLAFNPRCKRTQNR